MLASSACAQAIKLQHALELLETQTLHGFDKYLRELLNQAQKKQSKGVVRLVEKPEFTFSFLRSNVLLEKNQEHPKIQKLIDIITREFGENAGGKIMVFAHFRETASLISKRLNGLQGVKSMIFVGQAKKDGTGLNQEEQKDVIRKFSSGEFNVLCATSIGEEGLDIPEVNTVIFYEPIPSAIRAIQRAGRTARLMKGKLIILMAKKTRDESYFYVSRAKERKMHESISSIKEDFRNKGEKSIQKKL
jgi:ERCC4-related helicase